MVEALTSITDWLKKLGLRILEVQFREPCKGVSVLPWMRMKKPTIVGLVLSHFAGSALRCAQGIKGGIRREVLLCS